MNQPTEGRGDCRTPGIQVTDFSDAALRERARLILDELDKQLHEDSVGNLIIGKEIMISRITMAFIALRAEARAEQREAIELLKNALGHHYRGLSLADGWWQDVKLLVAAALRSQR